MSTTRIKQCNCPAGSWTCSQVLDPSLFLSMSSISSYSREIEYIFCRSGLDKSLVVLLGSKGSVLSGRASKWTTTKKVPSLQDETPLQACVIMQLNWLARQPFEGSKFDQFLLIIRGHRVFGRQPCLCLIILTHPSREPLSDMLQDFETCFFLRRPSCWIL